MKQKDFNILYVGEYRHSFDAKNRVTIPAKWRVEEDDELSYLAIPNPNGCVTVYPPKMVAKLHEKVSQVSLGNQKGQQALTRLFSRADNFYADKQGRISVSEKLLQHALLGKEVMFVGSFVTFSIWDPAKYEEYLARKVEGSDEMSEILKELGV